MNIDYLIFELRNELTNLDHAIRALEKIASADGSDSRRPAQKKSRARRKAALPSATVRTMSAAAGPV